MNFYKHHLGDYAQATAHLSFVEDAAYSRLIRKYYADERPIPADVKAAQRLVGARSKEEREAVETVLQEFFELQEDGWHNKRCDAELEKASAQAETNRRIAEEREARKRERSQHDQSTNRATDRSTNRQPSQTPDTRHQTPDSMSPSETKDSSKSDDLLVLDGVEPPPEPAAKGFPDCPHQRVLELWEEELPELPQHQPNLWNGARADHLRARWRETAASKGWRTADDGLAYLRKLFRHIRGSDFLMGRGRQLDPSRRPFVIELEWLVRPANWAKVHEGKYHPEKV